MGIGSFADGRAYRLFGLRGLFDMDAGLSLLAAIPLLWLVHRERLRAQRALETAA